MSACGGSTIASSTDGGQPSVDAATDALTAGYPSPPQALPSGGPVLTTPKVVPVFFANDPLQGRFETFLGQLASSTFWSATTLEYGVGALTVLPSVVAADPAPSEINDDQLSAWLASQADGTHAGWPKADETTVFAVLYPSTTKVTVHGKSSCAAFDGYHKAGIAAGGGNLLYAVLTRCVSTDAAALDEITVSASHELVEAATDPLYYTAPAFNGTDMDDYVWTVATVGEVSDLCTFEPQPNAHMGQFLVARSWSNAAATAGHAPCVPADPSPYFNAAAILPDTVNLIVNSTPIGTRGVHVAVGDMRVVEVVLHSDGATTPWRVEASDSSSLFGGPKELELSWDTQLGNNGDVLHLTIKALRPGPFGGSVLLLKSMQGSQGHIWLGFVGN
jgi:hypothetical protein